jgi:predicted phosphodiesterase
MKLAVISDIEGNDHALEQVLADVRNCDHIVNLGDTVGTRGDSDRAIHLLREAHAEAVFGNNDLEQVLQQKVAASKRMAGVLYDGNNRFRPDTHITDESRQYLERLDLRMTAEHNGLTLGFIHSIYGYHQDRLYFEYVGQKNAHQLIDQISGDLVFIGHKHIPALFTLEGKSSRYDRISRTMSIPLHADAKTIVNVGSIGASRNPAITRSYAIIDFVQAQVNVVVID